MTYTPTGQQSPEIALEKVGRELAAWRESNGAPKPIPTLLWNQAAELGRALGAGPVARQLRLDYGCLKRKMAETQAPPRTTDANATTNFLEFLAMPAPLGATIESCRVRLRPDSAQAVRERAIWAVGYRANRDSLAVLEQLLADSQVRRQAAEALSRLLGDQPVELPLSQHESEVYQRDRQQIPDLLQTLQTSQDADERLLAIESLSQIAAGPGAFPELLEPFLAALEDSQEEVPLYAVSGLQALSNRPAPREVPEIAEFLPAFAGLCEVAGRWAVHQAVPALLEWAQSSDRYAASAALVALARLGAGQARELLLKNLRKPTTSQETREALAVGLGRMSEPEVGPALTEVLGKCHFAEEAGLVRKLAGALGQLVFQPALPELMRAYRQSHPRNLRRKPKDFLARFDLEEHGYRTCEELLKAMSRLDVGDALPLLLEELASPHAAIRTRAALALAGDGSQLASQALKKALQDPQRRVREAAESALAGAE